MARERNGLAWAKETFGSEPRWIKPPDVSIIERLAREHLKINKQQLAPSDIIFFAQGGFNKLYKIQTEAQRSLMRVTLPVDPINKTRYVSYRPLDFAQPKRRILIIYTGVR